MTMDAISQTKLRILYRKTELLKSLLNEQNLNLQETKKSLDETIANVNASKKSNDALVSKIDIIRKYLASRTSTYERRKSTEKQLHEDLKQHITRRIYQLTQDIFPIEQINLLDQNNSFVNLETSPLLTFSDGSNNQIEQSTAYSIVEPWLPSDGDYGAYSLWVNDNKDHIPASVNDLSERNPAFRIGAGLALTSQLVVNMSNYLDVSLPSRVGLETFNRGLLDDTQFSFNVAKLNLNVLHLCISQGIDISLLNPHRALKNLLLLFNMNICDLGRKPIIEIDNEEAAKKIEDQLEPTLTLIQDELYDFSKFVDENDDFDSDWELSDSINPSEMQLAMEQSLQQNSYIANLPMRLFASFWSN